MHMSYKIYLFFFNHLRAPTCSHDVNGNKSMNFDIIFCKTDSANGNLLYHTTSTDTFPRLGSCRVSCNAVQEDSPACPRKHTHKNPILYPPVKRGNAKPGYFGESNDRLSSKLPSDNTSTMMVNHRIMSAQVSWLFSSGQADGRGPERDGEAGWDAPGSLL